MMNPRSYLACFLILFGAATRAFGLAGELKEPGLAFPERFPESARTHITAALRRPDCTYVGGHFINWLTTLKYGGETSALNRFLEGLAKCPGATLSVRFDKDRIPDGCDWLVCHDAGEPGRITVRVNLNSSRIRLDDLALPEVKGQPLSVANGSSHEHQTQANRPPADNQ